MLSKVLTYSLTMLLVICHCCVFGQGMQNITFSTIQKEDGLPNNLISDIVKDELGFLWIATGDGLCRYDSENKFKIFRANDHNIEGGIKSSNISTLFVDDEKNIWIGTRLGGLTRYNQETHSWTTFKHDPAIPNSISNNDILCIFEDSQHRIWVGTENGLNLFNRATETFISFLSDNKKTTSLQTKAILSIIEDDNGWIWVGTWAGGLHLLLSDEAGDISQGVFRNFLPDQSKESKNLWKIFQDSHNDYWLGTLGSGLYLMDLPENASNKINKQKWEPRFTNYQATPSKASSLANNGVKDILEDSKGQLWIGTMSGLSLLTKNQVNKRNQYARGNGPKPAFDFTNFYSNINDNNSLKSNDINTILEDDQGLLWFASSSGLSQYNWFLNQFNTYKLFGNSFKSTSRQNLYVDSSKKIWIAGGQKGMLQYDVINHKVTSLKERHPNLLIDDYVSCMMSPDDIHLYIASTTGISILNLLTNKVEKFAFPNWVLKQNASVNISKIFVDSQKRVWCCSVIGLFKISLEDNDYQFIEYDQHNKNTISDNTITDIIEDHAGHIWVATANGLNEITIETDGALHFKRFQADDTDALTSNRILSLEIIDQNLFIGSGDGLSKYNLQKRQFEKLNLDNHKFWIHNMISTADGEIWGSSTEGLFQYEPKSNTFSLFDKTGRIREVSFHVGSFALDNVGQIYFNQHEEITIFDPIKIIKNKVAPEVFITGIEKIGTNGKSQLECIGYDEVTIDANDYHITINFTALNYNQSEKNKYAYILEGLEESWNYLEKGKSVIYTNLTPKTYNFKVKACNNNDIWNQEGAEIKIIKQPFFWQTWWFYLLALFVIGALVIGAVQLYTFNIRKNNDNLKILNDNLNSEIDERKRVERALEQREKFSRTIMDSVPQFIYWVDRDFSILGANYNIIRFLDLASTEELKGKQIYDFPLDQDYLNEQSGFFRKVLESGKAVYNQISFSPASATAPAMWLEQSYVPLKDEGGEVMGLLITGANINQRVQSEQLAEENTRKINQYNAELRESNRDLEQFAYIASHDLKEPLRIIGNFSGLLARNYKGKLDANADEFISYIQDGAHRMSALIQSLLTYSQIGKKSEVTYDIDLNRLIDVKLFDLSKVIEERNAEVTVENLPVIDGERAQIGMIFYNLINNGIKFNKSARPRVHIKAVNNPDKSLWQFSVKDNGIGIEPIFQKQIFEIFKRLHSKHDYDGTGIGLSVCQKIIFRHGGQIWLESEHGNGTTFHFTIAKDLSNLKLNVDQQSKNHFATKHS